MEDLQFYLITYTDSSDVREQRVFTGWYENAKLALSGFSNFRSQVTQEITDFEIDFDHTVEQIMNNYNLYHNKTQVNAVWGNPTLVADATVDFNKTIEE